MDDERNQNSRFMVLNSTNFSLSPADSHVNWFLGPFGCFHWLCLLLWFYVVLKVHQGIDLHLSMKRFYVCFESLKQVLTKVDLIRSHNFLLYFLWLYHLLASLLGMYHLLAFLLEKLKVLHIFLVWVTGHLEFWSRLRVIASSRFFRLCRFFLFLRFFT